MPDRRTVEPHLVRAQVSAGLEKGAQLRRLVDGVGQPGRGADREGSGVKTAAAEGGTRRQRAAEGALAEPALWALVGNTPLIPLPPVAAHSRPLPPLFLKAEWLNPGGSVKDRAALSILRDGIARGELPANRVLDSSSGNTAIAYAMLGAAAGVGVTVCVPANASAERKALLETYGAEVVFTDPLEGSGGAIRAARDLAAAQPHPNWYAGQYYQPALATRKEFETTEDAEDAVRRLAQQAGVFVGWSSGAAIVAAERVLSAHPPATDRESFRVRPSDPVVVVIAPDSGTRYLSERRP